MTQKEKGKETRTKSALVDSFLLGLSLDRREEVGAVAVPCSVRE